MLSRTALIILAPLLCPLSLYAQKYSASAPVQSRDNEGHVTVRATRVETPPRVDGVLDEALYSALPPITDFIQTDPDEGQLATEPTLVWILFDERNLYISARCKDSQPWRIIANDMRRDGRNVTQGDNFSVVLDTFHDRRNGFEFLTNALGAALDTQFTDERDINRDWNAIWTVQSRRDDGGWSFEMAIPFRSLRYRGGGAQVWGINLRRNVRWKNELSYLSPVPRLYGPRGILRTSQAATLVGLEAPPASINLDFKPYAVGNVKADRAVDPSFRNHVDANGGFDLKYGVTQGLTADATVRTDFAQVEDDDQQVNLTRFNLLYPEKRDFFLEGQGIYAFGGVPTAPSTGGATAASTANANTPVLFFSRRIGINENRVVPIEVGARLTGRAGPYSVGLLDIRTESTPAAGMLSTNFGVVRLKRDILRRSYVGVLATHRSPRAVSTPGAGDNGVVGIDANFSFFRNLNLVGYYAGSRTGGRNGDDRSYRARFDYDADLFGFQAEQLGVGRNFNPEVGFLRRADFTERLVQSRISQRPKSKTIRKFNYEGAIDFITNGGGQTENRQARIGLRTDMQNGDAWNFGFNRDFELVTKPFEIASTPVPAGSYAWNTWRGSYTLGTQRRISGDLTAARGSFYGGTRTDAGYRGRTEITYRLSLEPGVSFNWVSLPSGDFTATLVSTRATFSFSPRMLTAALVQYNSTTRLMSTNIRFRWEYQPGSEIFVVYSDGRDTLARGFPAFMNRGFTVKVTRLFRM